MTALEAVVLVFGPEKLTNRQIRERTGIPMKNVAAYIVKLRKRGIVALACDGATRPFAYQIIDHEAVATAIASREASAQYGMRQASRIPVSVFHLADPGERMGFEPREYCERN